MSLCSAQVRRPRLQWTAPSIEALAEDTVAGGHGPKALPPAVSAARSGASGRRHTCTDELTAGRGHAVRDSALPSPLGDGIGPRGVAPADADGKGLQQALASMAQRVAGLQAQMELLLSHGALAKQTAGP